MNSHSDSVAIAPRNPRAFEAKPPLAIEREISSRLHATEEFRHSWRILCVGMVGLPLCLMPMSALGMFFSPLSDAFGWSLSSIGGLASVMGLGTIIAGPIEGRLIDRFGSRTVILAYIPIQASAVAAASLIREDVWTMYLVMFFWACIGAGLIANFVRAVSEWFKAGRGRAIGLMFTAGGFGCTIGPRLAQWVIDHYGWQAGYLCFAPIVLLAWPLAFFWLHERDTGTMANQKVATPETGYIRREAVRTRLFCYISVAWLLSGLTDGGFFFLVPFFEQSMNRNAAANCVSMLFAAGAVVNPLFGIINDRWYPPFVAAIAFLLNASAFVVLGLFGSQYAILAAVIAGVGVSGLSNSFFNCIQRYFGLRSFGEISGLIQSIGSTAGMIGPLMFSSLQEATGSYTASYVTVGIIAACAAGCMMMAGWHPFVADASKASHRVLGFEDELG